MVRNPEGSSGGLNVISYNTVTDGDWHHVAAVKCSDGKLYLYLDGKLESASIGSIPDFGDRSNHLLRLGQNLDAVGDDYRISVSRRIKSQMQQVGYFAGFVE